MKKAIIISLSIIAALAVITGAAYAFTDGGVIHACVKSDGQVRIVTDASECKKPETHIQWNIVGPPGSKGDPGSQGSQGLQGEVGPVGPQGLQGEIGPVGLQGSQGEVGSVGPQGLQGEIGPAGPQGDTGAVGPQGLKGDTGAVGPQGDTGAVGPQGLKGDTGAVGPQGLKGDTGAVGPQGPAGPAGPQGPKGDTVVVASQGSAGGMSFYKVSSTNTFYAYRTTRNIIVCNPSDTVIGGGYFASADLALSSWPYNDLYWEILGYNPTANDIVVTGYAICAHTTP
jgi:hypothetical protein